MRENIRQKFASIVGDDNIRIGEPMSLHTTFQVGGPADYFVMPGNSKEVKKAIELCKKEDIPYYIIGNGSNLIVRDQGYRGAIIQLYDHMCSCEIKGTKVKVQSGMKLSVLARLLCENGLKGFEFASGIPGTIGGAVSMNAGAYNGEMKDVVSGATVLDRNQEIRYLTLKELEMGYRTSKISREGYILLEAEMNLQKGSPEEIQSCIMDLTNRRNEKQPLDFPSAGSTFKRPEGYFAGKLIMDAGLAGFRIGNAMVSEKHCGFVVNAGQATAEDVINVIHAVIEKVEEKFGIRLEPEVKII